jgi:hypothetical protein
VRDASANPEEAGGDFDPILDNLTDDDDFVSQTGTPFTTSEPCPTPPKSEPGSSSTASTAGTSATRPFSFAFLFPSR